jgi:mevalonate kinase
LHHTISGGLEILNHTTTLPLSKGLSSSAAVCVLTARAFNLLYHLHLSTRGEMEFAYLGEVTTPSKCGRMDQGCAYGSVPIAMTFDRDILMVDRVDLAAPLHLVLVDLGASKCTTTILQSLQAHYPTPLDHNGERLQQLLGEFNLRVTADALSAMAAGNLQQLGALMREAQAEFDAAAGAVCPQQLAAPVLHQVLQHPPLQVRHARGMCGMPHSFNKA